MACKSSRAGMIGARQMVDGVMVGGLEHLILLALRGPGGMSSDQVYARFGSPANALQRLKSAGLIEMNGMGQKGKPIRLTEKGRSRVADDGPLSRRSSLITYCQL